MSNLFTLITIYKIVNSISVLSNQIHFSTNFRFVSYDTNEGIFYVSLLDFDVGLEYFTFFRVLRYILCLTVLHIAAVPNNCIYLMAFTMCDGSDYVTACFLFVH